MLSSLSGMGTVRVPDAHLKLNQSPFSLVGLGPYTPTGYSTTAGSFIETGLLAQCKSCILFIINSLAMRSFTAGSFIKQASSNVPKNANP